jgi:hypothetical protein
MDEAAGARWQLGYYYHENGRCPVGDFIAALKRSRPHEYGNALSKFGLFDAHGLQAALELRLVASLKGQGDIYELRVKGTGLRFYGFIWSPPSRETAYLMLASAEQKDRHPDAAIVRAAVEARDDWRKRFGTGD